MYKVLIVVFSSFILAMSQTYELMSSPSIEDIIRAHLRADGPSVEHNIPLNNHHFKRLTALSIREKTFKSFAIFRDGGPEILRMYNCEIEDFNSIEIMSGIKELHLRNCKIKDISPLGRLTKLTHLSLTDNHIEDVSALSRCRELTFLDLRNNKIECVSSLKKLRELVYLDLRDNPFRANSDDGDIRAIETNNPAIRILLGKKTDSSRVHLEQLLSDRAKIAEFVLCGRLRYEEGIVTPLLPQLSDEISDALIRLGKGNDREYLADIAGLLIKYVIDIEKYYRPGPVLSRGEEPLIDAFVDGIGLKVSEEGVPIVYIGNWICENRNKLAASCILDMQIEKRHNLFVELKRKGIYGSGE